MKTIKTIWDFIKLFLIVPLQILGGLIMTLSIFVFAIATLMNSPSLFMVKLRVVIASIKGIAQTARLEKLKQKFNNQTDGTF